jgi:stage II sporulation protein AA (anti-sigma F factor antagonist)
MLTFERNKNLIIKFAGDIDQHNAEEFRDRIDRAYDRSHCRHIIFDFSGVSFMDSSGIGLLIGRYKSVQSRGGSVAIANMNRDLERIYAISGLQKIITSYETLDQAEREIEGVQMRFRA